MGLPAHACALVGPLPTLDVLPDCYSCCSSSLFLVLSGNSALTLALVFSRLIE